MKVKTEIEEVKFKKIDLTITFDTKEEIQEFYTIFNYSPLAKHMSNLNFSAIRNSLKSAYTDVILNEHIKIEKLNQYVHDRISVGY